MSTAVQNRIRQEHEHRDMFGKVALMLLQAIRIRLELGDPIRLSTLMSEIRSGFNLEDYPIPPFFIEPNDRCVLWHSEDCLTATFCSRCDSSVEIAMDGMGACPYCGLGFRTVKEMAPTDDGEELMSFIHFDDHPETDDFLLQFMSSLETTLLRGLKDPNGKHEGGVEIEEANGLRQSSVFMGLMDHVQIDWNMLHKQKQSLLAVIDVLDNNDSLFDGLEGFIDPVPSAAEAREDLTGILNMVDALQDVASDLFGVWEFPKDQETEENG